ncbi:TlpA family protein disulfide reductase [Cochleicola gelatinilyticus]|uniref:Thioredoxin domain-containing protein n=1 Tax=Cochleicola gelatinilyticus TaxID=1763537 RepID=A0A167J7G3_9FLAO|nr:TlpA disulfide reductase family protein [Cochleicola gelatinilyticus]OAB80397.1 hypothetical protein ULVI_06590 [Cochleicola gelatinilyticus]
MFKKLLLLSILLPFTSVAQKTIKGNFAVDNGYKFGILYRIAPDNVFYLADSNVTPEGDFKLTLEDDIVPGMYRLVYNLPQDQHFFDFLLDGKEDVAFNFSADKNVTFITSEANKVYTTYRNQLNEYETSWEELFASEEVKNKELSKFLKERTKWYNETLKQSEGTAAAPFIKATQPLLTEKFTTKEAYLSEAKEAYFSNFNFRDATLQNSGIPLEQSLKYIFNFVDEADLKASYNKNIDALAKVIQPAEITYQKHLLTSIWDFMVVNELPDEANYLAENYLIPIAKTSTDPALANELELYRNLSLGAVAPDFSWTEDINGKTVSKTLRTLDEADNYIIVFWSALCSHCLSEVPKLHKEMATQPEGTFKVIAVGIEDEKYDWQNTILEMPDFAHVLGLGKWENEIGNKYDVSSTPTYFVLDKDKKIVAKPETYETLLEVIDQVKM